MELPFKEGDRLADLRLGSMGGTSRSIRDLRGRKVLVYVWGSWSDSRDGLRPLEEYHRAHPGLVIVTIACDAQGPEHPMRYLRAARASYEMWIDATCTLTRRWGVKKAGVLVLLDENGCVLLTGSMPDAAFFERLGKALPKAPAANPPPETKPDTKNTQIEILMQSCTNFLSRKRVSDAVGALEKALAIDPTNEIIPRQILALEHPEQVYSR